MTVVSIISWMQGPVQTVLDWGGQTKELTNESMGAANTPPLLFLLFQLNKSHLL